MEKKDFRVPKEGSCDMERGSKERRMRFPGGDRGFRGLTERGVEKGPGGVQRSLRDAEIISRGDMYRGPQRFSAHKKGFARA